LTQGLLTPSPLRLVIFDCDGVLVDSEGPAARVTAREVSALGWAMTQDEALARFIGLRLADMPALVAAHTGRKVPPGWVEHVRDRLIETLADEAEAIPGAIAVLQATTALDLPYRVASNSSHEEMAVKFARTGLAPLVAGRTHSARDVAAGKPAPDLFLAAAAAEGIAPDACVVVEDSLPGIRGALAAGMVCIGLDPHGSGEALRAAGAHPVRALSELPALFQAAMRAAA